VTHGTTPDRDDTPDYEAMAAQLDRWQQVPTDVLSAVVTRHGLCLSGPGPAKEPDWDAPSDRDLAAQLCAGCPVIGQCRELDLRTTSAATTGVWGALAEDDRHSLHRSWQRHRQHTGEQEGGLTS
jgi:WhiB family transcriptional regulator, redox-sensing transcriptional regulator